MIKKAIVFVVLIGVSIGLCYLVSDNADEYINDSIMKSAEIYEEPDYQEYKMLEDSGQLVRGVYSEDFSEVESDHGDQIRVTFADNQFLEISYYYDEKKESMINPVNCWVDPGARIYFEKPVSVNEKTDLYGFYGFEAFVIEDDEQSPTSVEIEVDASSILIPSAIKGKQLSIIPVGRYKNRIVTFSDYYVDEKNQRKELEGVWKLNDKEITDNSAEIKPTEGYNISYTFDPLKHYFVDSSPECSYNQSDLEHGIVNFDVSGLKEKTDSFEIELHELYKGEYKIATKGLVLGNKTVTIDGEEVKVSSKKTTRQYSLKCGEQIVIRSEKELSITDCAPLTPAEVKNGSEYTYTLTAPPIRSGSFGFDPKNYSFEHGTIVFTYQGKEINKKTSLADGSKLYYEARQLDDGYWLPDGEHVIDVNGDETDKKIKEIMIYPRELVTVHLPQPEVGGLIEYYSDDKRINEDKVEVYAGSAVRMVFVLWEGWQANTDENESRYIVTEEKDQIAKIDGADIETVFTERQDHQPALTVILDENIGENMVVGASYYVNGKLKSSSGSFKKQFSADHIDSNGGVLISAKDATITSGKALKIHSRMLTDDGVKTDIAYVKDALPAEYRLELYREDKIATDKTVYKSIEITVSLADVVEFEPVAVKNGKVAVKLDDTREPYELTKGDIIEPDREVVISVIPDEGFAVTGKDTSGGKYSKEMKYSKYRSDAETIIEGLHIKPTFFVTFDTSDPYGKVEFTSDGQSFVGRQAVFAGQKIMMNYEITDEAHEIVYSSRGIGSVIDKVRNKRKTSVEFEVTEDMADSVLTRESKISVK